MFNNCLEYIQYVVISLNTNLKPFDFLFGCVRKTKQYQNQNSGRIKLN